MTADVSEPLRHVSAAQLFLTLSRTLNTSLCNFHHFFQCKDFSSYICTNCSTHLEISPPPSSSLSVERCPIPDAPFHHYHVLVTSSDTEMTAECCQCGKQLNIKLAWSAIPLRTMREFLSPKDPQRQKVALKILFLYLRDMLKTEERKNINPENPKFASIMGRDAHCSAVMGSIGYFYDDYQRQFVFKYKDIKDLQLAFHEVQFERWKKGGAPGPGDEWTNFANATGSICSSIGALGQTADNIGKWKDLTTDTNSELLKCYETLGLTKDTSDANVRWTYERLQSEDQKSLPLYLSAIAHLAQLRNSNSLQEFVAIEKSKGVPLEPEVQEAYRLLGLTEAASQDAIIDAYNREIMRKPESQHDLREALKIIAFARDSPIIEHFINTGEIYERQGFAEIRPTAMAIDTKNLPAGLENIGNTCYLNSLLQLYATIRELRDAVIGFKPPSLPEVSPPASTSIDSGIDVVTDGNEAGKLDRGSSVASAQNEKREQLRLKRSCDFMQQLQALFGSMIWSDYVSFTPSRQLAEIALNSENIFGQQQDISESMDNIMDMLETALRSALPEHQEYRDIIKRLFFGKTRQTLTYEDNNGTEQTSNKDEEFSHLIVEVSDNLYSSLDSYFDTTKVSLEGKEAQKDLSIVEIPPVLTIFIRRAKFDRDANQAYKSNDYVRFEKTLFMDRYMTQNIPIVRPRREQAKALSEALKAQTEGYPVSPPEKMMEIALCHLQATTQGSGKDDADLVQMKADLERLREQSADMNSKLQKALCYDDMTELEYRLHAVFVHMGEAAFGHYWTYIWDGELQRWLKYNDAQVTEVPEADVFSDTTGSTANAYALIYVRAKDVKQLVDTHARSISTRNYYLEHFPEISHQAILRKEQGLGPFDPVSIDDASKIGNGPAINPEGYAKPGTPMDVMANSEAIGNEDSSSKPDGPHNQGQTENPSKDIIASPGEPENSAEPMDVEQVEEMSAQR